MALLGDDGLGLDLARRLEACGVWRPWLGDANYATFVRFLESPSSWEAFMCADDTKSRFQIQLQMRARALLFDKASVSLSPRLVPDYSSSLSSDVDVLKLNPAYLQLHGDDVYYTLEHCSQDGVPQRDGAVASNSAPSVIQAKSASSAGSKYAESESDNKSPRVVHEEFPDSWYTQFIEKYNVSRPYMLPSGDRERTPEDMLAYLRHLEKYKRRRMVLNEDHGNPNLDIKSNVHSNSILDTNNSVENDTPFFPEILYAWNCVPETALLSQTDRAEDNQKMEFYGVLDTMPQVMHRARSPIMIERLGIRPESLPTEHRRNLYRGKNGSEGSKKHLGEEQASQLSKKVIATMLINAGFEGATEVPVGVLSRLLSCHICKLGRILKALADSYRKQCSAIELLRMFLSTAGYSNLEVLAEKVRESTRAAMQQTQPHVQGIQSPPQPPQHQSPILQKLQAPRQMHLPVQQMAHPQNLVLQRRQVVTPHSVMNMDNERPLAQVKIEESELLADGNGFNAMGNRHPQLQAQQSQLQQQYSAMSSLQAHPGNQFRQTPSPQAPQVHSQGMGTVRAPPVKVEGFQELMGGDAAPITSPSK